MGIEVSVHELKRELSRLLTEAERGGRVVVTRYGRPIVEFGPAGRTGGFDFSADDPERAAFGLDGEPMPVPEDLDDPAWANGLLGAD